MSAPKNRKKFHFCLGCQQIRHVPHSNKGKEPPKRCQACSRLWRRLLEVLSLCYIRWEDWDQKFPSLHSFDDNLPSIDEIRDIILSLMDEIEVKVYKKYLEHLILKESSIKGDLEKYKQLEKKPYYLKKETNEDPEWDLTQESGKQKDFIIRCLYSFKIALDVDIIIYQNKKIENEKKKESQLLIQKKSLEDKLQSKDQEIKDLRSALKQTSITCPICLNVPQGGPHTRFECGHWMCQTCRESFDSPKCHICKGPTSPESKLYF